MSRPFDFVWVIFLALGFLSGQGALAGAEGDKTKPLDQELLKKLGGPPGDDLDRELFAPATPSKKNEPASRPSGRPDEPSGKNQGDRTKRPSDATEIGNRQSAASGSAGDGPLVEIVRQMRQAESLLAQANTTDKTQEVQMQILRQLDELLRQTSKRSSGGSCSSPGGSKPASAAGAAQSAGPAEIRHQAVRTRRSQSHGGRPQTAQELSGISLRRRRLKVPWQQRRRLDEKTLGQFAHARTPANAAVACRGFLAEIPRDDRRVFPTARGRGEGRVQMTASARKETSWGGQACLLGLI